MLLQRFITSAFMLLTLFGAVACANEKEREATEMDAPTITVWIGATLDEVTTSSTLPVRFVGPDAHAGFCAFEPHIVTLKGMPDGEDMIINNVRGTLLMAYNGRISSIGIFPQLEKLTAKQALELIDELIAAFKKHGWIATKQPEKEIYYSNPLVSYSRDEFLAVLETEKENVMWKSSIPFNAYSETQTSQIELSRQPDGKYLVSVTLGSRFIPPLWVEDPELTRHQRDKLRHVLEKD